jgi:uncharacterized membrane protein YoaK (UPF0700 family)
MISHPAFAQRAVPRSVPAVLSFVAGYIDSCTFLALFGLFVAQATGSFVLVGTQLVAHEQSGVLKVLAIPVFFLAGVATTVGVEYAGRHGRSALPNILAVEAVLLAGLFFAWLVGAPFSGPNAPAALVASLFGLAAMGVQSALVRLTIPHCPSTNVMTTNTTQLAIDAAELVMTWRAWRRAPADATIAGDHARVKARWRVLWPIVLGFLVGTIVGALAYTRLDLWSVLLAIAIVAVLAVGARLRPSAQAT